MEHIRYNNYIQDFLLYPLYQYSSTLSALASIRLPHLPEIGLFNTKSMIGIVA